MFRMSVTVLHLLALLAAAAGAEQAPFLTHFYTGTRETGVLESGPALINHTLPLTLRWAFVCPGLKTCIQTMLHVQLVDARNMTAFDSGLLAGDVPALPLPAETLQEARRYSWRVRVQGGPLDSAPVWSAWSAYQLLVSSLASWSAVPVWSPRNATGLQPLFAFLRRSVQWPLDRVLRTALLFITANPPSTGNAPNNGTDPPKVLAAYKVWVGQRLIGMGPGRPRCGPGACAYGLPEHMYDGFDVTSAMLDQKAEVQSDWTVDLFITGYGVTEPKVAVDLRILFEDGSALAVRTGDAEWHALDADPVYNPTGNSGCAWYSHAH
jgi:hypothetical protein